MTWKAKKQKPGKFSIHLVKIFAFIYHDRRYPYGDHVTVGFESGASVCILLNLAFDLKVFDLLVFPRLYIVEVV